jgi:hypothetical protein
MIDRVQKLRDDRLEMLEVQHTVSWQPSQLVNSKKATVGLGDIRAPPQVFDLGVREGRPFLTGVDMEHLAVPHLPAQLPIHAPTQC